MNILLHHYPTSPFAEKIRLILGYKDLTWQSVYQPMVMPKPDLQALTGGYRRIPVLQVGNQIVCDTLLICDVLEHLAPEKTLYPPSIEGVARTVAQWADSTLFSVAMAYNFQPAGAQHVFRGQPEESLKMFAADRQAMRSGASRMHPSDAAATYKSYLCRISNMLDSQAFLLGSQPSVADFAIYHSLWFTRQIVPPVAGILQATPTVLTWMDRMSAFGQGRPSKSSTMESIAACAVSTNAQDLFGSEAEFQNEHGIALGEQVSIAAESFGMEPSMGELVAATRTRYSIRRVDGHAGEVFVHFPRIGFILKKAN
ncbi:MAG: glutathione S-transferase family protein [Gammaproteobacteria bacterium]|nr:glutathione S-transferase family protein [Gammaproteobacteria bacterium]